MLGAAWGLLAIYIRGLVSKLILHAWCSDAKTGCATVSCHKPAKAHRPEDSATALLAMTGHVEPGRWASSPRSSFTQLLIRVSAGGAGGARVKDCLEEHREDAGFSAECKEEFENMMEARAADFRLDAKLRDLCANDIEDVCGYEKVRGPTIAFYAVKFFT